MKTLSHSDARIFYDRLGAKQDWQRFFEDAAIGDLVRTLELQNVHSVLEFGCGTGRLAESLLNQHLSPTAEYVAIDVSSTMVTLARKRLTQFGPRARVLQSPGEMKLDVESGRYDRFISTYVLDLLSPADSAALLVEAHRVMSPGGLLGLVSLTHGQTSISRVIAGVWTGVYYFSPSLVGGCRPIQLREFAVKSMWRVRHTRVVTHFGLSSEVLVAQRLGV
jgi:ubiquinone/menaquinone biosynthesis C-methylase UbiE